MSPQRTPRSPLVLEEHGRDGQQRAARRDFQRLAEKELAPDCHSFVSGARYVEAPFMSACV